mmetsp:Transcript_11964/g.35252  ORF Transcript_11964/g.35252 Transcript_11964/m.35252 type:complete len:212 (+) Transcript_11964:500-1135(+)
MTLSTPIMCRFLGSIRSSAATSSWVHNLLNAKFRWRHVHNVKAGMQCILLEHRFGVDGALQSENAMPGLHCLEKFGSSDLSWRLGCAVIRSVWRKVVGLEGQHPLKALQVHDKALDREVGDIRLVRSHIREQARVRCVGHCLALGPQKVEPAILSGRRSTPPDVRQMRIFVDTLAVLQSVPLAALGTSTARRVYTQQGGIRLQHIHGAAHP